MNYEIVHSTVLYSNVGLLFSEGCELTKNYSKNQFTKNISDCLQKSFKIFSASELFSAVLKTANVGIKSFEMYQAAALLIPGITKAVIIYSINSENGKMERLAIAIDNNIGKLAGVVSTAFGIVLIAMGSPVFSLVGLNLCLNLATLYVRDKNSSILSYEYDHQNPLPIIDEANQKQLELKELSEKWQKDLEPLLSNQSALEILSIQDLIYLFDDRINRMQETTDSKKYGEYLREVEGICLRLQREPGFDPAQLDIIKDKFQIAYQNQPNGQSQFLQRDLDQIKKFNIVPHQVVCQNDQGKTFCQPEISMMQLCSLVKDQGYANVMFSRKIAGFNDNQIPEMTDVVMIPKKSTHSYLPTWRDDRWLLGYASEEERLENEIATLSNRLKTKVESLGYAGLFIGLIKDLKDKDYATRLIDQGFDIYCVFKYRHHE